VRCWFRVWSYELRPACHKLRGVMPLSRLVLCAVGGESKRFAPAGLIGIDRIAPRFKRFEEAHVPEYFNEEGLIRQTTATRSWPVEWERRESEWG